MLNYSCRVCSSNDFEVVFNFGHVPLAGGFISSAEQIDKEIKYNLEVLFCKSCTLIQIPNDIDPEILFGDYSFSSSTIPFLVQHFNELANEIKNIFSPNKVFEIGCNDGVLLLPLKNLGVESLGIDAAPNIVDVAKSKNLNVINGYFNEKTSNDILSEYGKFDVIVASNAFPHNSKPIEILNGISNLLSDSGVLILEVMYAGDLLEKLQWDTLYHEHLNFYSLYSISELLKINGFKVFDAKLIPMHGGSLRIFASRKELTTTKNYERLKTSDLELKMKSYNSWKQMSSDSLRQIDRVKKVINSLSKEYSVYSYGAAGKATMWLNICELRNIKFMIDASPFRYGKLMPGTHTPIISPSEFREIHDADFIFVTAWNYLDTIRNQEKEFKGYWITPLPQMRIE